MPDGDKVHKKLSRRYQSAYVQLCADEEDYEDARLAHTLLNALKKDLKDSGLAPTTLIKQVAEQLQQLPTTPLLQEFVDWGEISWIIEKLTQQATQHAIDLIGIPLARKACEQQVQDLRNIGPSLNLVLDITKKYLRLLYAAKFEESVPLTSEHYQRREQAVVNQRLVSVRPHIEHGIAILAAQLVRDGTTLGSLRLPPRKGGRHPIDVNDVLPVMVQGVGG